jgi:hypothetical protein
MSGKQRAVLWLGIILITLNFVTKWSEIKAVIFTGSSTAPSGGGSGSSGGGGIGSLLPGGLLSPFAASGLLLSNTPATNTVTPV